ncbi:hypothetical protein GCM10028895_10790 [Pontibacter rugosus]
MVNLQEVKNDPEVQLTNLNAAIERSGRDGSLYARRAVALLRIGMLEQALQDAEEAVKLTKNEPSTLFVKAQVLRALGKADEALPLALQAERNSYQTASLFVLLGELYLSRHEYEQAKQYIQKAQDLAPTDEFAYYYKGRVQEATGDTLKSIQNYRNALAQAPDFMEPKRELAAILIAKEDYAAAKPYLLSAQKVAPEDAKLWFNHGLLYQAERKQDSAVVAFNKALSINDTISGAHYRVGLYQHGLGNNEEAVLHLQKAYNTYKNKPDYLSKLASAYERTGQFSSALITYQRLIAVEPRYTYAYQAVARLKYKLAKPQPDSAAVRLQDY